MSSEKYYMIRQLRHEILRLQGSERISGEAGIDFGLEPICEHFPNGRFPVAAVHELICRDVEGAAANASWVSGLAGRLMQRQGACIWIRTGRRLGPAGKGPDRTGNGLNGSGVGLGRSGSGAERSGIELNPSGLARFGVAADQVIFLDVRNEKEALWAFEESLKCEGLAAVVGEVREVDFTAARRFQLAVEKSHTTGFILRDRPRLLGTNACAARWAIRPLPSEVVVSGMPGLGFPRWSVELMRVKNGRPGRWEVEWRDGRFEVMQEVGQKNAMPREEMDAVQRVAGMVAAVAGRTGAGSTESDEMQIERRRVV